MLNIDFENNSIELTRGDTARITFKILNGVDNSEYEMKPEDVLELTVRKSDRRDSDVCLKKKLVGTNTFHFEPKDTKSLDFKEYRYDVQITTKDGDVYTIIPPSTFKVLSEVTY